MGESARGGSTGGDRGHKVTLDADLAELYGVETKVRM
jgi:hypothetical protein